MLMILYFMISILLTVYGLVKRWYWLVGGGYLGFLVVFCAVIPLPGEDKKVEIAPTQVVFRFDDYRYLQLTGSGCQGKLYYIDEQKQVYNELAVHSARVLTEPFAHTVGDYIFIPRSDYSSVRYSQDGGRTFKSIPVFGSGVLQREHIIRIEVVDNQLFIYSTKGIYYSPQPFGTDIGVEILSPADLQYVYGYMRYMGLRWENQQKELPPIPADYKGWYRWQCDINLKQHEVIYNRYEPLHQLQIRLRQMLGLNMLEEQ